MIKLKCKLALSVMSVITSFLVTSCSTESITEFLTSTNNNHNYDTKAQAINSPQNGWRWCSKCQGMWYSLNDTNGTCPAGGGHTHNGSGHYYHYYDSIPFGYQNEWQHNWSWCSKCQGLFYSGNSSQGVCPAGGSHVKTTGAADYYVSITPLDGTQSLWKWCKKCQGLFYSGNASQGPCPAGGNHDYSESGNYYIFY